MLNRNTYQILGKKVSVTLADPSIMPEVFERFSCSAKESEITMSFDSDTEEKSCYGMGYLSEGNKSIKNVFFSQKNRGQMLYRYDDDDSVFQLQIDETCTKDILSELLMIGFYSYVSSQSTLLLHASAVCCKEKAIAFVAASGTGKTTQAELWERYAEADILNGDKVFLKKEDGGIIAWGSPWNGSSSYAKNEGAKLAAIIVLEQAEENRIRKLSGMEVLEKVVPHVFFPNWDRECEEKVFEFLDEVLGSTDVYLLSCRPDEDAVRLVEKEIFYRCKKEN